MCKYVYAKQKHLGRKNQSEEPLQTGRCTKKALIPRSQK